MTEYRFTRRDKIAINDYAKWLHLWITTQAKDKEVLGLRSSEQIKADEEFVQNVTISVISCMSWADVRVPKLNGYMDKFLELVHRKIGECERYRIRNRKCLDDLFDEYDPLAANSLRRHSAVRNIETQTENSVVLQQETESRATELRPALGRTDLRADAADLGLSARQIDTKLDTKMVADFNSIAISVPETSVAGQMRTFPMKPFGRQAESGVKDVTSQRTIKDRLFSLLKCGREKYKKKDKAVLDNS